MLCPGGPGNFWGTRVRMSIRTTSVHVSVGKAEVVADLVEDGLADLAADVRFRVGRGQDPSTVDRDAVGRDEMVVGPPLAVRRALIEAEQVVLRRQAERVDF